MGAAEAEAADGAFAVVMVVVDVVFDVDVLLAVPVEATDTDRLEESSGVGLM